MGRQIIQQPGTDKFCVYSTETDTIIFWDATAEELTEAFAAEAAEDTRTQVAWLIDEVKKGQPRRPYGQFQRSWAEALESDRAHEGEAWRELATGPAEEKP